MGDRPLAIDLYAGLGGWAEGLLAEGYRVVGFDNERHVYGEHKYPGQLVVQDVRTLHGRQFKDAALIVASPPCQEYSYMAMPWSRAKQIARALRGEDDFPEGYTGSRTIAELNELFDACFRIQREACEASGRHIPLVVENVRGAQDWAGKARWNYGSYYLWGDVPALMPITRRGVKVGGFSWSDYGKDDYQAKAFNGQAAIKNSGGSWFRVAHNTTRGTNLNPVHTPHMTNPAEHESGIKQGGDWFNSDQPSISRKTSSRSPKRKMASALIAKIPFELARHIATTYHPERYVA